MRQIECDIYQTTLEMHQFSADLQGMRNDHALKGLQKWLMIAEKERDCVPMVMSRESFPLLADE